MLLFVKSPAYAGLFWLISPEINLGEGWGEGSPFSRTFPYNYRLA
jgi:hypothetical protein